MEEVSKNWNFLNKIVKLKTKRWVRFAIVACTDSEFKSLVECIVNSKSLPLNKQEKKLLKKCSLLVEYLQKKVKSSEKKKADLSRKKVSIVLLKIIGVCSSFWLVFFQKCWTLNCYAFLIHHHHQPKKRKIKL